MLATEHLETHISSNQCISVALEQKQQRMRPPLGQLATQTPLLAVV
jgi:hypothetical protein